MSDYKYLIDKKAVTDFFFQEVPTKQSLKAIHMVITAVILKHFAKYVNISEDLHSLCMVALLERKERYDPSYPAYNYAFTICRNEINNYLNKQREVVVEDILPIYNASVDPEVAQLPQEVNKFKLYLTGEKQFEVIEMSKKDAINLILFCETINPSRRIEPPEFIKNNEKSIYLLYRVLTKL